MSELDRLDKLHRFHEALKRGKLGRVESFELWLRNRGFNPEKVNSKYIHRFFLNNPLKIVNYDEQLEKIGGFVGLNLSDGKKYHIPLIGIKGSGKSLLLNAVRYMLESLDEELNVKASDASLFAETLDDDEFLFYEFLDTLDSGVNVVIVDSCERDQRIVESLREINRRAGDSVYLTAWTPEKWRYFVEGVEDLLPVSTEIFLEPFEIQHTRELVDTLMEFLRRDGALEVDAASLHEFSLGIPGIVVDLFIQSLKEAFLKGKDAVDREAVEGAAQKMGIIKIMDKLNSLSDIQLTILNSILLSWDERGVRPMMLVEELNKDKATISYHLHTLLSEGILEVERSGRSAFYRIRRFAIPFVQLKLMEMVEYG